jgi:hypothetical protein
MNRANVNEAAVLDLKHSHAYQAVPEYTGTEIHKSHAKSHLVKGIFDTGCMCYTWNFANEGSLQRLKRICEGSNYKDEQFRLASFTSMRLARRLRRGHGSGLDQSDKVQYVDVEPTNLMLASESATDDILIRLVAPSCFGAWEVEYVIQDGKRFGVGDWALCDCGGHCAALVQVTRMVQVSVRDESSLSPGEEVDDDSDDDDDAAGDVGLTTLMRICAFQYVPGVKRLASRGNAMSVKRVGNEGS